MKKVWLSMLIVLAVMNSCNNTQSGGGKNSPEITKGEECSVKVSGVEFTKSLNGAYATTTVEGDKIVLTCNANQ